jgi:hypothetical protein
VFHGEAGWAKMPQAVGFLPARASAISTGRSFEIVSKVSCVMCWSFKYLYMAGLFAGAVVGTAGLARENGEWEGHLDGWVGGWLTGG